MARKTIQPSKKFLEAVKKVQTALRDQRLWWYQFTMDPVQSGPPPTPPRTAIKFVKGTMPIDKIDDQTVIDSRSVLENDQIADTFSTKELKDALEEQIANKSGDTITGVKASELRAVALQSQVLNGLRRRGAKRQLNRLDRVARAAYRRQLLANNDGPLQSVLVKKVEDTLARVNSSS